MTLNFKVSRDFVRLALFTSFLCAATQASAITLLGGDGNFYRKTTTKLGYVKKIALVNDLSAEGISIAWATYDYNAKTFFGKLTPSQSGVLEAFSAAPIKKASINVYRNVHAVVVPANPLLPVILIETNPRAENYEQVEQGGFEKYQYQPLSRLNFELQPKSAWFDSDDTKYVPGCAGAVSTSDRWGQLFSLTPIDIKHFGLIAATGLSEKELRNFAAPQC